ncbi:MAG: DUF2459 domain-containing protein, partial [Ignavibacteriaceae bacterium]
MLNLIIPFFFFFLSTPINFAEAKTVYDMDSSYTTIYLVKQRWHTGILIQTKIVDTLIWKEVNDFKNLDWIDIGWGDEEFYQHPDFDAGLAFRALFYSTPSALRIEGFNISKEKYFKISNIVIELKFDKKMFKNICEYFNKSFK